MVFSLTKLLTTVASFLGPDKRNIKDSSDIHLSFFIVLPDFFQEKRSFSDSKHIEPPQRFRNHDIYQKYPDELNDRPRSREKVDHRFFVVII